MFVSKDLLLYVLGRKLCHVWELDIEHARNYVIVDHEPWPTSTTGVPTQLYYNNRVSFYTDKRHVWRRNNKCIHQNHRDLDADTRAFYEDFWLFLSRVAARGYTRHITLWFLDNHKSITVVNTKLGVDYYISDLDTHNLCNGYIGFVLWSDFKAVRIFLDKDKRICTSTPTS
jgi:hypothetical protein